MDTREGRNVTSMHAVMTENERLSDCCAVGWIFALTFTFSQSAFLLNMQSSILRALVHGVYLGIEDLPSSRSCLQCRVLCQR